MKNVNQDSILRYVNRGKKERERETDRQTEEGRKEEGKKKKKE